MFIFLIYVLYTQAYWMLSSSVGNLIQWLLLSSRWKKISCRCLFYQIAKLYRDNFELEYELTLLIYNFTHFYFSGQLFIQIFYIMKKYFHCIFYLYIPCSHVWLFKKNDKNCSVFCLYLEYKICDPIKSGVNRNMG